MPLRTVIFSWPIPSDCIGCAGDHGLVAYFFSVRDVFPSLAPLVQLDRLRADNKLSSHVRLFQCHRYRTRYQYSLPSCVIHQETSCQPRSKDRTDRYIWAWNLVCLLILVTGMYAELQH